MSSLTRLMASALLMLGLALPSAPAARAPWQAAQTSRVICAWKGR